MVLGGNFTLFNSVLAKHIARVNVDGSVDGGGFASNLGNGVDNIVQAITLQPDNRIVLVGSFAQNNGVPRNRITPTVAVVGLVDTSINFVLGANGDINAVLVQPADGMLVIGGGFTLFNGQVHDRIARIYGGSSVEGSVVVASGSALVQEGFNPANGIIDSGENVGVLFAFRDSAGGNV